MNGSIPEEMEFSPDSHTYRVFGKIVPSVTQLTDIYSTQSVEDGDDLELTMEAAAERGTQLHAYLEHRIRGGDQDDFELPDSYSGYLDAVELFLSEHALYPLMTETPMHGEDEGVAFAGTPDFVGEFDGLLSILDWKFVSQVQKTKVGTQLNGYLSLCFANDIYPDALYCVQFLQDGTYRLYPAGQNEDSFRLCLSVYKERAKRHPRGGIA